jgi:mannose-6-phosphate isomerase-like protein (cupin superfamily)
MAIEKIYRHVTGVDSTGKSVFISSGELEPDEVFFQPGTKFWRLWGTETDGPVIDGDSNMAPFFPEFHGTRFSLVGFPPHSLARATESQVRSPEELEALRREADERLPGLFDAHATDGGTSLFHATETVDYGIVLDGEIHLELDDGQEVVVTPGHCIVQRGTRHQWINKSDQPALMAFIVMGARRSR